MSMINQTTNTQILKVRSRIICLLGDINSIDFDLLSGESDLLRKRRDTLTRKYEYEMSVLRLLTE